MLVYLLMDLFIMDLLVIYTVGCIKSVTVFGPEFRSLGL